MSVLSVLFNPKVSQFSPNRPTVSQLVEYDKKGNEIITYPIVDYFKVVESHGSFLDWSLNKLLSAGIDPNFAIHTDSVSRLDGVNTIVSIVNDELNSVNVESDKVE